MPTKPTSSINGKARTLLLIWWDKLVVVDYMTIRCKALILSSGDEMLLSWYCQRRAICYRSLVRNLRSVDLELLYLMTTRTTWNLKIKPKWCVQWTKWIKLNGKHDKNSYQNHLKGRHSDTRHILLIYSYEIKSSKELHTIFAPFIYILLSVKLECTATVWLDYKIIYKE